MRIPILFTLFIAASLHSTSQAQNTSSGFGAPPPYNFGSTPSTPSSVPSGNVQNLSNQPSARIASNPTGGMAVPDLSKPAIGEKNDSAVSIPAQSILGLIRGGGVMMIPILSCSFLLVVFIFERFVNLRKGRVIPKPFVRGVMEQLEQQQLDQDEAIALCEENASPIARLFAGALKKWGRPAVEIEQAVVDTGAHVTSDLKKYLRLFSAISNLGPLLGLLGTVHGMIEAFNSIAHSGAMGRPEMLAEAIGIALITTAAGLVVAIPAYIAYVFFLGRVDSLILEMDALVSDVIESISAEALSNRSRSKTRKAA